MSTLQSLRVTTVICAWKPGIERRVQEAHLRRRHDLQIASRAGGHVERDLVLARAARAVAVRAQRHVRPRHGHALEHRQAIAGRLVQYRHRDAPGVDHDQLDLVVGRQRAAHADLGLDAGHVRILVDREHPDGRLDHDGRRGAAQDGVAAPRNAERG
jgi:hypothetical protein